MLVYTIAELIDDKKLYFSEGDKDNSYNLWDAKVFTLVEVFKLAEYFLNQGRSIYIESHIAKI